MRPVIALLSDFGTKDHYAGTMKGVILGICPEATLVDITHGIAAHDVLEGALQLAASYRYFPAGTVFLAVVDPGVGSARRGLAAEAGDYRFVAPDNGVLTRSPARDAAAPRGRAVGAQVRPADGDADVRGPRSLRAGRGVAGEGDTAQRARARRDGLSPPRCPGSGAHPTALRGAVLAIDRFGNLVTNIDRKTFEAFAKQGEFRILAGGEPVGRLVSTYAEIQPEEVCALFGSSDHLELAANAVSAAERLGLARYAVVEIRRD